jgi:hypothetical protein
MAKQTSTAGRLPSSADIVIVGAGVAGLYCAYRLLKENPGRKLIILERLDRIGGRLDTDLVKIKDLDGQTIDVVEEEGGMRFNESMTELLALLQDLGMYEQIITFGSGDDNNYYNVRGRSFTVAESKLNNNAIWGTLYDLLPSERNKSPNDIITAIFHDLVVQNGESVPTNPTPEFWLRFRLDFKYKNIPLNEWGLWALYRSYGLSQECINMLADSSGFPAVFFAGIPAGGAYQLLEEFPASPQFYTLSKGYESLALELQKRIDAIQRRPSVFLLTEVNGIDSKAGRFAVTARRGEERVSVSCSQIILALPATAIQQLQTTSPALNAEKNPHAEELQKDIESVIPLPLCKVNLYYNQAWWRDQIEGPVPNVANGGSFTSLPLGSVYVFDPAVVGDATGPAGLSIYCDFINANFWQTLQDIGPKFTSPLQKEHNRTRPQVMFPASEAIVREATKQLRELFQMISVPRPVLTSFRMWNGAHQFGYAAHRWALFADDRKVRKSIASPVKNIFVCNEAFSDDQGWVNGSLRSSNIILQTYFGIQPLPPMTEPLPASG